ncbi:hypothetical protein AB205_0120130 [Aquarana catesbeiana]|uniref:Uncharacterized protein n=1 Tax=Aquarana catesbeiana TaxID=8400 RepID=A0A2G9RC31_AQUCT|nr:hypothetical protein AB205_0120130 [Aquarana catesbeiana]
MVSHAGEKRIRTSEDTSNPTLPEEGKLSTQPEADVDVVEEETHFSSASAQVLISEIMVSWCAIVI